MSEYLYDLKQSLITETERGYLKAIKNSLPYGYFVQPQVNLASIIQKNGGGKFQNELFRNIDACVFDLSYKPILLIEINDNSHNYAHRRERDIKVRNICEEAGIQLITFWTRYGINEEYIRGRVNKAIQDAPYYKRVSHQSAYEDNNTVVSQPQKYSIPRFFQNNSKQKYKNKRRSVDNSSIWRSIIALVILWAMYQYFSSF